MLTESQERRLRGALTVLVEAAPDSSEMTVASPGRRQRPALVGAFAFVLLFLIMAPVPHLFMTALGILCPYV